MMAKVSFILPAYKRRFLKEAIASILAQTYRDFELVVVDDCSPENLKEVVDEFRDERLTYHRNEQNIGGKDLVAAWNRAMDFATGEWCVLASDDDVYLPRFLETLMGLREKYPQCDLFHARTALIDGDGNWTKIAATRGEFESQVQFTYMRAVLRAEQRMPDFMFRKSAWQALGGFVQIPLAWYSDDATWMALAKKGCVNSSEIVFCFRNSGINLSSQDDRTALAKIEGGEKFRLWFAAFAKGLQAKNQEEEILLRTLVEQTNRQIDSLENCVVDGIVSDDVWRQAVGKLPRSRREKRVRFYVRHPKLMALRMFLPHF